MARDDEAAREAALAQGDRRIDDAARRRLVPPAEQQEISVVDVELTERALERTAHQRGDPRVALHHHGDLVAMSARDLTHALAECLRAQAAPVEATESAIVGALHLARRERAAPGGEP
jgi:hypothetical protein